jgi:hypothetical protein
MKTLFALPVVLLCTLLQGCSDSTPSSSATTAEPVAAGTGAAATEQAVPTERATEITKENQGILTNMQREGLNAANQTSDLLKEADEARRKQIEAQGL